MWLTDLADVARAAGLDVREAPGWKTRGHGAMTDVQTITCHHTGSTGTNDISLTLLIEGRPDLPGPIANVGVGRSGRIYVVAAGVAWHAGESCDPSFTNHHAVGIEAQASGTDPWPAVQMDAYARLCKALADHYRLPYTRVLGHKETCAPKGRKVDPNFDMTAFRRRITTLEDDMPLTEADAKTIWRSDIIPDPTGKDSWQADTYLRKILTEVRAVRAAIDPASVAAAVVAQLPASGLTQAQIEAAFRTVLGSLDDGQGA